MLPCEEHMEEVARFLGGAELTAGYRLAGRARDLGVFGRHTKYIIYSEYNGF